MQDNQLTRLSHYINTGFPCDKKNLPTDLQEFWNHREVLSIKSGLITCGSRIIVPKEMRAEMLQYIHEGHQGKERCLLRARNTVFWPKITYDIQEIIERYIICQEHGKFQSIIGTSQELPPFPWHTLATDIFYWKRMDFLIVTDVFSKYFLVMKLANSTSAAVCAEIATIVTELGLSHIIRSDYGPCYNSKEFQQLLQHYYITHHTSSPHHPRSNGFVKRMVRVAKKLMDKAGSEGKPWISGLYEYRVTPQSGSIASPLQLITQCTPREKDLPQSKEFQQLLQHYYITHHTSSPHHPRSNGFVERMVRVAKKLMDKAGSEGKPWILGLYEYRVTPQSGSIASPLQLITQCTPREKDLPQLLSTLGAQEMYETHQELIRRQQNKPEKNYFELTQGMPVWVQHRQNTSWEPATVMSQCTSNSYWIMQENGTDQPKVYRRTRTMLKIRCTNFGQTRHSNSQSTESEKAEFHTPAISNMTRNAQFCRKYITGPCSTEQIGH